MDKLISKNALLQELEITDEWCGRCRWGGKNETCRRGDDFKDACRAICNAPIIEEEKRESNDVLHMS